jgi:hypothetical protein
MLAVSSDSRGVLAMIGTRSVSKQPTPRSPFCISSPLHTNSPARPSRANSRAASTAHSEWLWITAPAPRSGTRCRTAADTR